MNDLINGLYEALGGVMIMFSVWRVLKDKRVAGVSLVPIAFFTSWGFWNLYYYPSLGQWLSFAGGVSVVSVNVVWLTLMAYYKRFPGGRQ